MTSPSSNRCCSLVFAVFPVLLLIGCGNSDRASASGRLMRADGSPLVGARVIATSSETGTTAYGQTDSDGRFSLGVAAEGDGVPPGDYRVAIIERRGDSDIPPPATISKKYRDSTTSGLHLAVESGQKASLDAQLDAP